MDRMGEQIVVQTGMKRIKVDKTDSSGIVMGRVFIVHKMPQLIPDTYAITEEERNLEIQKIERAIQDVSSELELEKTALGTDEVSSKKVVNEILSTHQMIVNDVGFAKKIKSIILNHHRNAQQALEECCNELCEVFRTSDNSYMSERDTDIDDICSRLMHKLKGSENNPFATLQTPAILVAEELAPSDICKMNRELVLGFITKEGSISGHVSIIAKNMEIPALVGVEEILDVVTPDSFVIMDAHAGIILIDPDDATVAHYQAIQKEVEEEKKRTEKVLKELAKELTAEDLDVHQPMLTKDGRTIKIHANVGSIQEIKTALTHGVTGVGLFRTEILYMEHTHFPTEDEQFQVYQEAAMLCGAGVTIRTLDIGGDKTLDYFPIAQEAPNFAELRGIRISLGMQEIFKEQIKAILRAGAYGIVRMLLPMVVSREEIEESIRLIEVCKAELRERAVPYDNEMKIGIMIETPEAVREVRQFAKMVDFFSIGTNDLTQYILMAERGNRESVNRYEQGHPSVLAAIEQTIEAARAERISVGMCGELAGDADYTERLLDMGLDELSMASSKTVQIRNIIKHKLTI